MKKAKKFLTMVLCLGFCTLFVGCNSAKGNDNDASSSDTGSGIHSGSTGSSSDEPVIEDVDFTARETVFYQPSDDSGTLVYEGNTYTTTAASSFGTVSVNPWEKNVKFRMVADEKTNGNHGIFNLLASATDGCAGLNKRYFIPGIKVHENYAQFYNYWSDNNTKKDCINKRR